MKKKLVQILILIFQVAAFICEPVMATAGVVVPPKDYLKQVYQ
jgi:adenosylmethionine-8-amino-7-oxononanoate aminotransferase